MPRTKKPAGTAVNPRNGRQFELESSAAGAAPEIDRSQFEPVALAMWDAYWADPASSTQTPADIMVALNWVESYNDYRQHKAAADREPLVEGSMGQIVANPLYAVANQALQAAERAAKQMGIGAKNRADLGVTIVQGKVALDDLNARYLTPEGDCDDADDDSRRAAGA
jgi:hypothetical protein